MSDEEQVLYTSAPAMFLNSPVIFILCLLLVVIGWIILFVWWLRTTNTRLTVTNERVALQTGIFAINRREVFLSDIRSVQISQSFWQRIFRIGTVEVSSAATGDAEISIEGIPNPYKVKQFIDEHRRKERRTTNE